MSNENKRSEEQKDSQEDQSNPIPARPTTDAESQLDNMQDVDMNTIKKQAGTDKKEEKE